MENSIWSLVPPILAILMVLTTKRVIISLGVGILSAALIIEAFRPIDTLLLIIHSFKTVVIEDGALNTWNIYILVFLCMLGILTAFVSMMGGTRAFGDWMIKRVKTRIGAQLMTMVFGIIIFVDDYFNSLTVGPISSPVTDKHRISRQKLAYIVDSTAAPISVIAPVSSWGAYIIGIIGSVLVAQNVTTYSALEAFLLMIPMNFYVWTALGVILVITWSNVDFGPMRKFEQRAIQLGELGERKKNRHLNDGNMLTESKLGTVKDLLLPIIVLFMATIVTIYMNGWFAVRDKSLINIFGEADVSFALVIGGAASLFVTFLLFLRHFKHEELQVSHFMKGIIEGLNSMLPAIYILIFAWTISFLIDELGTGAYLAMIVEQASFNAAYLPVIVFVVAGLIAFSTGTSWGSFAILLPIGGQIAGATDIDLLLPVLAAVLAGAVFGDHCSPISDTTILSSTGANCELMDHVITQLPYALVAATITAFGYITLGLLGSVWLGLLSILIGIIIFYFIMLRLPKIEEHV